MESFRLQKYLETAQI